ncbi:MAG: TRIC cation channel family protein, partial [Opitutae bacterium]
TDCVSATSYNEYWQLLDSELPLSDTTIFRFENSVDRLLEDGLYVDRVRLEDPEFLDALIRFTRASLAGWAFSAERPAEAVEILLQRFPNLDRTHQTRMATEIVRLIDQDNEPLGRLSVEGFDAHAEFLGYDIGVTDREHNPIIDAWSHTVWRMLDDYDHSPLSDEVLYRLEKVLASSAFYILDLLGTLAFGLAGFARASERRYDLWGALVLTSLPAVGGGTLRDVIVGGDRHPPFIFEDPNYLYIVATIVIVGTIWDRLGPTGRPLINTDSTLFLAIDTIGLAAFCIIGAKVAILAQLDWFWIPMLAAVTCAGGGVIMDVVSGREPRTFRGVMYEEIAIFGGLVLMALLYLAQFANNVELFIQVAIIQTFILVYALKIVSVQMGWTAPKLGARLEE